ncbi:hypothetical protein [Moorena sp. SIO3H5]|uniref:hypothetical protein n=1 Tax=Moorena sp. SIO3H5 TaxID=2607834 RepID=UPI0013BD68F8|nr:hypothetical protein [Moorena sp. SIO3H5]NEO68544.1 hypothetical protein [Moorena sp. SIO3H5]
MMMSQKKSLVIICLILIAVVGVVINVKLLQVWNYNTEGHDIYYSWVEGKRILSGENPYARVLSGNMRENQKYATYFPLFYWLSALTQLLGFQDYSDWISLWRPIFLMVNIGIAGLIFYHLYNHNLFIFGWFAALFWLLNRWTLYVSIDANLDFLGIFFLILSLMLLPKHKLTAFLMFSFSLGIKQIAIFLLPLYLIWAWQSSEDNPVKDTLIALLLILVIPGITSLPFILWNAEGFFKSILFSATRNPDGHVNAPSLDGLITLSNPDFIGIKAKLPMLLVMSLVFLSAIKRQIGIYTSALLTMCVFIEFNSVIFNQYFCWVVPLLPLASCEILLKKDAK